MYLISLSNKVPPYHNLLHILENNLLHLSFDLMHKMVVSLLRFVTRCPMVKMQSNKCLKKCGPPLLQYSFTSQVQYKVLRSLDEVIDTVFSFKRLQCFSFASRQ